MKSLGLLSLLCCFTILSLCQIPDQILGSLNNASDQWLLEITELDLNTKLDANHCSSFLDQENALTQLESSIVNDYCSTLLEIRALSDLYFPLFEKKLESIGLNDDYKYLPFVLSGLNPHYESSFDRAGLWQLSFAVAKRFGLSVSTKIDERKAADLSTDAALAQLKFLNEKYDGDQEMVKLAFLRSPMYAQKMRDRCIQKGITIEEGMEPLDRAWFEYLALAKEFVTSGTSTDALFVFIKQLNRYENIAFTRDVSYRALATILKLDEKALKSANPAFHHDIIPSGYRGVVFIMPKEKALAFPALADSIYSFEDQRIAAIEKAKAKEAEKIAKGIPDMTNREHKTYKVRSGDVLGSIADRFGVRVSDLKTWNDVRGDMIYIGQTLVLYPKKGTTDKAQAKKGQEKPKADMTSITPGNTFENYTVKPGESLWLIAKKFPGVSSDNIMDWNGIDADIRPGQVLKIYR